MTRHAVIRSVDDTPFEILSYESDNESVEIWEDGDTKNSDNKNVHKLVVRFTPSNTGESFLSGNLSIRTDRVKSAPIVIPWSSVLRDIPGELEAISTR